MCWQKAGQNNALLDPFQAETVVANQPDFLAAARKSGLQNRLLLADWAILASLKQPV